MSRPRRAIRPPAPLSATLAATLLAGLLVAATLIAPGRAQDPPPPDAPVAPLTTPGPTAAGDAAPVAVETTAGEQVVAGLSQDAVSITTTFTGSEILIFGAVKRDAPLPPGPPIGVIVTVQGPSQSVKIRRKERRFGIWVNTDSLTVGAAPDFYVVATSAPLGQLLSPAEDVQHRISIPLAIRSFAVPVQVADTTEFTAALLRLRTEAGRYALEEGAVSVIDQTLFRAEVTLPANLIEGQYKTSIFLVRDGQVVSAYSAPIAVKKVGLERWLYQLALEQPFWYGLMSLAFAVAAGWLASAAFRLIRRN
ncbi:TIGR02186 family protein [uncultured Paracoccus sp.]|uniref:TIGR02186 family protein n=1 Tax=uncultured Paracoccus sp. TaxID=189685 RepID=UPI00261459EC|nr:TIGR02186 family protein [uncultured Paracoccus sp.]